VDALERAANEIRPSWAELPPTINSQPAAAAAVPPAEITWRMPADPRGPVRPSDPTEIDFDLPGRGRGLRRALAVAALCLGAGLGLLVVRATDRAPDVSAARPPVAAPAAPLASPRVPVAVDSAGAAATDRPVPRIEAERAPVPSARLARSADRRTPKLHARRGARAAAKPVKKAVSSPIRKGGLARERVRPAEPKRARQGPGFVSPNPY
jgi:hypothetical protein